MVPEPPPSRSIRSDPLGVCRICQKRRKSHECSSPRKMLPRLPNHRRLKAHCSPKEIADLSRFISTLLPADQVNRRRDAAMVAALEQHVFSQDESARLFIQRLSLKYLLWPNCQGIDYKRFLPLLFRARMRRIQCRSRFDHTRFRISAHQEN